MRLSILRWSIFGYFLVLGLIPTAAYASDCPPDDPSRSDCKSAASTARSPLVPIAGAAAGAGAGWVLTQIMGQGAAGTATDASEAATETDEDEEGDESTEDGEEKEGDEAEEEEAQSAEDTTVATEDQEPKPKGNPCAADEAALTKAMVRTQLERWNVSQAANALSALEARYNSAWWAGFSGSMLDVGFFGLSAWAPNLGEGFIKERIKSILMQKMAKEFAGAFAKELGKDAINSLLGEGGSMIEQGESMAKQMADAYKQTLVTEILPGVNSRWGLVGLDPATQAPTMLVGAKSPFAKVLQESMGTLLGAGWALHDMEDNVRASHKVLEALAKQIAKLKAIVTEQSDLKDAIEDEESARRVLERCRQIWSM